MLKFDTLLQLGRVVVTTALLEALRIGDEPDLAVQVRDLAPLLVRHESGDWGEVGPEDSRENDRAVKTGARVLSAYTVRGIRIWIMTDAASDVCPACWAGIGVCEPDRGVWSNGLHFRDDLLLSRLSTTVMRPEDY
jgi:hypothetical protein